MTHEILQQLILAVALAIVSLVFWALRELVSVGIAYLKSKLGETNFQRIRAFADVIVKTLAQSPIYEDLDGAKKKELAKVAVLQFAQKHNLPIDEEMIDKFIEASVQEMKAQVGKIEWDLVPGTLDLDGGALTGSTN